MFCVFFYVLLCGVYWGRGRIEIRIGFGVGVGVRILGLKGQ